MKLGVVRRPGTLDRLCDALVGEGHQLIWVADDARSAERRAAEIVPDAILCAVDVSDAAKMRDLVRSLKDSAPVIMVFRNQSELAIVDDSLAAGASTALEWTKDEAAMSQLRSRIATIARLTNRSRPRPGRNVPLVLIGASTGGPEALSAIVADLPGDFAGAIVVVQHIEAEYVSSLADTLSARTSLRVEAANEGARLASGSVFVAAGRGRHLVGDSGSVLRYVTEPRDAAHSPSIDVLFESMVHGAPGVAVLLTGMGRDGARGLLALRRAGWHTIAQDEATSVVYGMPRAAAELRAAREILPLSAIARSIVRHTRGPASP